MLLGYDDREKYEILQNAITISKPTMSKKISRDLEMVSDSKEIDQIYQENISHLMKYTYLFKPKGNRNKLMRQILLQGISHEVNEWEGIGGEISLNLSNFSYQFVKGRMKMVKILKDYVIELIRVDYGVDIIISNYKAYRHQKKIVLEYININL